MSDRASLRGLHLHFDCASGVAGDMTLGALFALGVPEEVVRAAVAAVGVDPARLDATPVVKGGIAAIDVKVDAHAPFDRSVHPERSPDGVRAESKEHQHGHGHADQSVHPERSPGEVRAESKEHQHGHGHADQSVHPERSPDGVRAESKEHGHADQSVHPERSPDGVRAESKEHGHGTAYREIVPRLERLEGDTRVRALDMFSRIARAEASLHGTTPDEVHFHEVGAIDSLVDIVGTAAALAWLAPAQVSCDAVAMGHGTIRCAHGVLPVPSPAALEILREAGGRTIDGGVARELCTPTGAAIVASAVTAWGPMPPLAPVAVGYGAGDADLADRPNVLRVIAGRPSDAMADTVWRVEANVDDMSAELCEHAVEALFAAGALDVWWTPITMKRGRPALLLAALAPGARRDAVVDAVLRETTTIGVRTDRVERRVLDRELVWVETPLGRARIKVARAGGLVLNAAPEYRDCRQLADEHGVPLKRVFAIVSAAYERLAASEKGKPA